MTLAPPFLRWAGSKRKQISLLSAYWSNDHKRYVEPFMGSACLFFSLAPDKALLGDINSPLVRTFLAVRDHPRAVANRLLRIPQGKISYYRVRAINWDALNDIDLAAYFIFLNRYCFNGIYRTNRDGVFNVPYSPSKTGPLADLCSLKKASEALQNARVLNKDFETILNSTKTGDFVYLDPPYAVSNRRLFRQYGPSSFGLHDLARLSKQLLAMNSKGVSFVLSYANCKEAFDHFGDWPYRRIFVQRNVAGFAAHRRLAGEIVFSNIPLS